MIDLRLRSKIAPEELQTKIGRICTDEDYNLLLTRDATVRKPDGSLLCIYRRQAFGADLLEASYPALHQLREVKTRNRAHASGSRKVRGSRTEAIQVSSALVGALDYDRPTFHCRLTAWTGRETERFRSLWPLFQAIATEFRQLVPDRYAAQLARVERTRPEWIIPGTPFSTVTVNNTYPTGVHTDRGDLHEGFSNLTVLRRGRYRGGIFLFPEYRLAIDMGHGDLLLMDAHEWHGNTRLQLESPDAERISVVCYYRTAMTACLSGPEEFERARAAVERKHLETTR